MFKCTLLVCLNKMKIDDGKRYIPFLLQVKCSMQARYRDRGISSEKHFSSDLFAGIKVGLVLAYAA